MPSDPQAVLARHTATLSISDPLGDRHACWVCGGNKFPCDAVLMARALAESEKRVRMLEALDGPFRWLGEHYPKAFREMPTEYIWAFDTARAALLEGEPDAR